MSGHTISANHLVYLLAVCGHPAAAFSFGPAASQHGFRIASPPCVLSLAMVLL